MHILGLVLVGTAIAVGLLGIILPILPGAAIVLGAILAWALVEKTTTGWVVLGVAATVIVVTQVLKYVLPERHLRGQGVPWTSSAVGVVVGIVGFFVVPVIGLPLGYVVGVFVTETIRRRSLRLGWRATVAALKAVGISTVIEFAGALVAAYAWAAGVLLG